MTTKDIVTEARKKGLCKEWFADFLKDNSIKHLCERFFEGSDWTMENDFPTLSILQKFKYEAELYGLFADYEGVSGFQKSAFFGKSKAEIVASGCDVKEIYIRHDSELKLTISGNAYVVVNVLDNAKVDIDISGEAQLTVYNYSENSTIVGKGNFKVLKSYFN